ncbi:MAG: stage II sporulation protein M [Candidatus Aenigmatarchaeota archaeon]
MVLESILDPKKAEDNPWKVLIVSMVFAAIAIFLAYNLFPAQASILSVAFITIFFVPFFQRLFRLEEKKDCEESKRRKKHNFFTRHRKVVLVYSAFFIGLIITYSIVFMFFHVDAVFTLQTDWFKQQGMVTANVIDAGGFFKYLFNNTQVMILFFILSVLFGAGAVFILAWNASIIAVYLGILSDKFVTSFGAHGAYLYGMTVGTSTIILHGVPEIMGYFFAGIGGGILSIGLLREKFMSKEFNEVGKDALIWLALGEVLIVVGAVIEAVL